MQKRIDILDSYIAWREAGHGDPVVFLHGNPTSSFLWRNIIPFLSPLGRCIAPDLIGMGDSGRIVGTPHPRHGLMVQRAYFEAFLQAIDVRERVTLVLHDWGSVVGFDWANRHRGAVRAIAYMEAVVRPVSREDLDPQTVAMFETLRSPAGEHLILQENMYVEQAMPAQVLRRLEPAEMEAYRAPYREPGEGRRAMLDLCREVPFDGTPREVLEAEAAYAAWLPATTFPKLFVNAEPGAFLTGAKRDFCRSWRNQEEVTVPGMHFLQEDSPEEIGVALATWFSRVQSSTNNFAERDDGNGTI